MSGFQENLTIRWITTTLTGEFTKGCNVRRNPVKSKKTQCRNEQCQCGSGKKFKNCCLGKRSSDQ